MAQPYIGEIRIFAGNFNPAGWDFCDGQLLPISENEALFQLIGTTYGGDGEQTFGLPNLQSRVPMHMGRGVDGVTYTIGEAAGVEEVTLTTQQIPVHSHPVLATNAPGTVTSPSNNVLAAGSVAGSNVYGTDNPLAPLNANSVSVVGGNQPHENCQPFLCVNFIISLFGIFPQPT